MGMLRMKRSTKIASMTKLSTQPGTRQTTPLLSMQEIRERALQPPEHCARCKKTLYCSHEYQKTDWDTYKMHCGKAYMQPLREEDVLVHLIDAPMLDFQR